MFKNPEGGSAGKLIDELGLKGQRMGQAVISEIHGNFIINQGGASAQDVLNLMELVRKRAREDRGVELEIEVQRLGL
jgi:UDP-N-acetylenolpyruvoylglucosamine reductase